MLYYKFSAALSDKNQTRELYGVKDKQEQKRLVEVKTRQYNMKKSNVFYFISRIFTDEITGGILEDGPETNINDVKRFFEYLEIKTEEEYGEETTLEKIFEELRVASRSGYIEEHESVLERFGIDMIATRKGISYGENLIYDEAEYADLLHTAEENLFNDSFDPELMRIYSGKKPKCFYGHPVQYMVETNDRDNRKLMSRAVMQALYCNDRLFSKRYSYIDVFPDFAPPYSQLESLYKSSFAGAVVVRYFPEADQDEEGRHASDELESIGVVCDMIKKYHNVVLTVICLPRECERIKKIFFDCLGRISVVEIKENLSDYSTACEYMKKTAKRQKIRTDKCLFSKLDEDKKYYPNELSDIFDEWYDNKLKNSIYGQYKTVTPAVKEALKTPNHPGSAYDTLNAMIGLNEAKAVIKKALNYYRMQQLYKDKGVKQERTSMHMVFTGNPGTAKTTVARLFARIMKENGILSSGHLVEVGRSDLVGKYVGWTAKAVKEKFKQAAGGILFIDEAYSLVDDRDGSYGDEAINTIVQEMENMRDDLVVIFAGYPDKMEAFLDKNPGLRSRIAFHVPFADYTATELCDIAKLIGKTKGVTFTDGAITKLHTAFEIAKVQPDFGNGRYVRNVIELSKMNLASRIIEMDPDKVSRDVLSKIEAEDIELPVIKSAKINTIGFAV